MRESSCSVDDQRVRMQWFLDALDEWGCEENAARAAAIIDFIASGFDLSPYEERPRLRVVTPTAREQT